ncbi:MAG: HDOD domain-containing protein [Opitutaceae bacterium]
MVDPPLTGERALRTIDRAKDALRSGRAVGLPELLKLIQTMSSDPQGVDVATLAGIVQKDAVILARVLSTAQTLAYNASGAHVTSLAQAIHIVGYGRIRTLTMSLLIADAAGGRPATEEHKQAAATAICSGFVAESIAQELRFCDREEAFIGACLRHLGTIVMAAFMVEDFRTATAMRGGDSNAAWRQVFGLTPLELGREILKRECAPDEVATYFGEYHPGSRRSDGETSADPLPAICEFSSRLAAASLGAGGDSAVCARQIKEFAIRFGPVIPDLEGRLEPILASAGEQLRDFMRDRRISSLPESTVNRFMRRTEAFARLAAAERNPQAVPAAGGRGAPEPPGEFVMTSAEKWTAAQARLERLLASPGVSLPRVLAHAVELLRSGFSAPEILVFSGHGPRGEALLTGGSGEFFLQLPGDVAVAPGERSVLGVCLKYRENVLIHDAADAKIVPHVPDWLKTDAAPSAFAIFPLIGGRELGGLVLVGWEEPLRLSIAADAAAALAKFLHALGIYCEHP